MATATDESDDDITYLEERHEDFGIESYFLKVWGYDSTDFEHEITDYAALSYSDLIAVHELLKDRGIVS